jgi:hypothetical protein
VNSENAILAMLCSVVLCCVVLCSVRCIDLLGDNDVTTSVADVADDEPAKTRLAWHPAAITYSHWCAGTGPGEGGTCR